MKYSFILSIPAILGAAVLELGDMASEGVSASMMGNYLAGMAAAAICGYFAIRTIGNLVKKRKMKYFAFYCIAIGILAIVGHFFL